MDAGSSAGPNNKMNIYPMPCTKNASVLTGIY